MKENYFQLDISLTRIKNKLCADEEVCLTEKGSAIFRRKESPRNFEAETIFIDFVILAMFWVPVILALTNQSIGIFSG